MFVWLDEIARAHRLIVGAARGQVHRVSKPGTGLRQSWMERAYHSGFNLCETRSFPDRVLWRCMAPAKFRLLPIEPFAVLWAEKQACPVGS